MGLEPAIHPLALWPGDRRTGLRVDRRSSPRHSVPCSAGGLQADLSDHLGPAQKLLRVLTASGRAWRHRLAVKYARYYRGEPVAPDTPSHSSNSLSNSCARPQHPSEDQTSSLVATRSTTAAVNSVVPAPPPRSGVLVPEAIVSSVPS